MNLDDIQNVKSLNMNEPTVLFETDNHRIFWLGIERNTVFRSNAYLIADGDDYFLIDPGGPRDFPYVRSRVSQITSPKNVSAVILCHQDPDVTGSLKNWLDVNPALRVFTSPRTHVLLPHYGIPDYGFVDIESQTNHAFKSGNTLQFIGASFMHSPMAFTTYDEVSNYLFTGDIFAAIDSDWRLVVDDFQGHRAKLDLFHTEYMASNLAARGFLRNLSGFAVNALLPQHGSLIPERYVKDAFAYLRNLQCGLDLIYPDLE